MHGGQNHKAEGMRRPTIKDVAERAKVSLKTVSRVINNEPSVMQATRSRRPTLWPILAKYRMYR